MLSIDSDPLKALLLEEDDLAYEEDIIRNPFYLRAWLRYIDHKTARCTDTRSVNMVFERALKEFPGSYKLWYRYIKYRKVNERSHCITDVFFDEINDIFERSLVFMNKMPRIWITYVEFLMSQCKITKCRRVLDRALKSLPITQHDRIWPLYIKLVNQHNIPEVAVRVYRRYIKVYPERIEDYIDFLLDTYDDLGLEGCHALSVNILEECALLYVSLLNNESFVSRKGKSRYQLWNELCDFVSKHPLDVPTIKFEQIIKQGIERYADQVGILWNSLSNYFTRAGDIERARDIYEEALLKVVTVRDFAQVFDAYSQFEEGFVTRLIESAKCKNTVLNEEDEIEMELRLTRLELLMDRRPLLLNSVLLRQNPHNVSEWIRRVELLEGRTSKIVETFKEAVKTVDPLKASGKVASIWIQYALFYEKLNKFTEADAVFKEASQAKFKTVDDLASIWCEWVEMKLRQKAFKDAIALLEEATTCPSYKVDYFDTSEPVQKRLHKNIKIWSLYADLEESFGTFESCKAVYDAIIDLRVCSPQIIINYGNFLEENDYYEEAFRAYEKGVSVFPWPVVYEIWLIYLTKFMHRYKDSKIERARDLFEQCLESCTPEHCKVLYLLYAKLEDQYGLARRALKVYARAVDAVPVEQKFEIFEMYIQRTAEHKGITATREVYEKAIESLNDSDSRVMCLRYSDLETKLGEIDRARAIYLHCSQICDPRITQNFWQTWKDFETKHGTEDTLRDMLRIRRSVQATYNVQVNYMAAQMMCSVPPSNPNDGEVNMSDTNMEEKAAMLARQTIDDRLKNVGSGGKNVQFIQGGYASENTTMDISNPDRIDIPDVD
ncbi:hypothetical protein GJ496_004479 [Pomphorhynchus laevis]|nr:hypothetical protein GJ496_004479 [Pomphorhynchus laevis]